MMRPHTEDAGGKSNALFKKRVGRAVKRFRKNRVVTGLQHARVLGKRTCCSSQERATNGAIQRHASLLISLS